MEKIKFANLTVFALFFGIALIESEATRIFSLLDIYPQRVYAKFEGNILCQGRLKYSSWSRSEQLF